MLLELEPARAKAKNAVNLWDDSEWIAEEKLDGWRYLAHFGHELDRCYFTGRRVSKTTGSFSEKGLCIPKIWPNSNGLAYTVLDGEVMSPKGFRDIAGIMNVAPEKAAKRIAEIGHPTYHVFDILFHDRVDVRGHSLIERQSLLAQVMARQENPLISIVPYSTRTLSTYDRIVESGGEGVILKDLLAPYGEGWVKVKKYSTLDVVITGFTEAKVGKTGKYVGLIGAAIVSVYGTSGNLLEVGRVSGMTDDVRRDMSENHGRWVGSVIEVAAQEFAKERLRHPRFKRARPDANPRHATLTKMMADLGQGDRPDARQIAFPF